MSGYILYVILFLVIPLNAAQPPSQFSHSLKYFSLIASNGIPIHVPESIGHTLMQLLNIKACDKINCLRFASIAPRELEDTLVSIQQNSEIPENNQPVSDLRKKLSDNAKWQDHLETVIGKSYSIEDFLADGDLTLVKRWKGVALNASYLSLVSLTGFARIDCISYLEDLNLSNNKFTHLKAQGFLPLPRLQRLSLQNNQISEIDPNAFNGLGQLKTLLLKNNCLNDGCLNSLAKLTALTFLELDHNPEVSTINNALVHTLSRLNTVLLNITRVPIDARKNLDSITQQRSCSMPQLSTTALPIPSRNIPAQIPSNALPQPQVKKSNWFEKLFS